MGCGVVGTRSQLDGISLYNMTTGTRTLPVKRWDELRSRWTAEDAPYINIPEWKLPRAGDGKVDFNMIPQMPRSMTLDKPCNRIFDVLTLLPSYDGCLGFLCPAKPDDNRSSICRRVATQLPSDAQVAPLPGLSVSLRTK